MLKICNINKIFGKKIVDTLWNIGYLKNGNVWWRSEEDLDNIDNGKEEDGNVDDSSFDNEQMKKIFKMVKREVDKLNGTTNMWMIL